MTDRQKVYDSRRKRKTFYVSETFKEKLTARIEELGIKGAGLYLSTLLELEKKYGFLEDGWKAKLWNTEIAKQLERELREKIAAEGRVSPLAINHNCMYVCPFVLEEGKVLCMCEWSSKRRIIKVTNEWCNICYEKSFVIPKPKTELELREEEERAAQEKRDLLRRATINTGSQVFSPHREERRIDPFREPKNGWG